MRRALLTIGHECYLMPSLEKANKVAQLMQDAEPVIYASTFGPDLKITGSKVQLEVRTLAEGATIKRKDKQPAS